MILQFNGHQVKGIINKTVAKHIECTAHGGFAKQRPALYHFPDMRLLLSDSGTQTGNLREEQTVSEALRGWGFAPGV
jgi:hypothetical protein